MLYPPTAGLESTSRVTIRAATLPFAPSIPREGYGGTMAADDVVRLLASKGGHYTGSVKMIRALRVDQPRFCWGPNFGPPGTTHTRIIRMAAVKVRRSLTFE